MRTGLAASTVTPGRTAPDVSRAIPDSVACAYATTGASTNSASAVRVLTILRIANLHPKLPLLLEQP
jgi:hypothetical protein